MSKPIEYSGYNESIRSGMSGYAGARSARNGYEQNVVTGGVSNPVQTDLTIDEPKYRFQDSNKDYYFVDNHEAEKKRSNQAYSNLMGREMGDPELKSQYSHQGNGKNTLDLNLGGEQEKQKYAEINRQMPKLMPSLHYSEVKNSGNIWGYKCVLCVISWSREILLFMLILILLLL